MGYREPLRFMVGDAALTGSWTRILNSRTGGSLSMLEIQIL